MNEKTQRLAIFIAALLAICLVLATVNACIPASEEKDSPLTAPLSFKEGDIIFQTTNSTQYRAIQLATGSRYTHCGILFEKDGRMQVLEAIQTVTWTPLEQWMARGTDGRYVLTRLKEHDRLLPPSTISELKKAAVPMMGKSYDLLFQWSDDTIYCSELVWKIYERGANIVLAPLRTFRDYHLDNPIVRAIIEQRYGKSINLDEKVVAPSDILESPLVEKVGGN